MRQEARLVKDLVVVASHGKDHIDKCLKSLGKKYEVLVLDDCPLGYSGKYLWAYWNHPAENYLFIQDSMEAVEEDYLAHFKEVQPERGCAAWAKFPMMWDSQQQVDWANYLYGTDHPEWGIFGPIFYVNRASLDELKEKQLLPPPPMNKQQAQGTERLWALAFHNAGMEVTGKHWQFDTESMNSGAFGIFKKTWVNRK